MENLNIRNNSYYLLIGICPLLVLSSKVTISLVGGIVFFFVILFTMFTSRVLRNFLKKRHYESFVLIISVFYVSLFKIILLALGLDTVKDMGIYFSLIGVNSYIVFLYEKEHSKYSINIIELIKIVGFYFVFIFIFSFVRELLGTGKIDFVFRFGENKIGGVMDLSNLFAIFSNSPEPTNYGLPLFILPSGGFILLGIIVAIYQYIKIRKKYKMDLEKEQD